MEKIKKILLLLMLIFSISLFSNQVNADEKICVVYFYSDVCSHCATLKPYLDNIENKYKDEIELTRYEIHNNIENYKSYNKFCGIQSIPLEQRGVPLVAIGNNFYMGNIDIKNNLESKIGEMIKTGERKCPLEGDMTCHQVDGNKSDVTPISIKEKVTLPLVLSYGLADGFNPCAFGVLILLVAFLIGISANKKRVLKLGIIYVAIIYIAYFLAGLGLLSVLQGFSSQIISIKKIIGVILIVFGVINTKDFFFYGKGFSLKIPESQKGTIKNFIYKGTIPAIILLGFFVSAVELGCTAGLYLAIIAMMVDTVTRVNAILYLLAYNFMFVLPLIIILILLLIGTHEKHVQEWIQDKRKYMRLIMGLLLLITGIGMLIGII